MTIEEIPLSEQQAAETPTPTQRQHGLWRDAVRETLRFLVSIDSMIGNPNAAVLPEPGVTGVSHNGE